MAERELNLPLHSPTPEAGFEFPSEAARQLVSLASGYVPLEPLPPRPEQIIEERLADGFVDWVGQLSVGSLAVVMPRRGRPKSLGNFRFVPIIGPERYTQRLSLFALGYRCIVSPEVRATFTYKGYTHNNGRPYIDAQRAIGLVNSDWLVAVAAAGIDDDGSAKIVQIQDVTSIASRPGKEGLQDRVHTGLYDGFYWRDTLVEGWREVATKAGCTQLVMQGGRNDAVAGRMHFAPRPNGDWAVPLDD